MKTFRMIGMALVAMVLCLGMSSCSNDDEEENPYKDYPQLIVGKWFNFTPDASVFLSYQEDGTFNMVGYDNKLGWMEYGAAYRLEGDKIFLTRLDIDDVGESKIELTENRLVFKASDGLDETVHYRVKTSFDIKGNYSYLNSVVRVVPAAGKTALQLPEGVTFNGQNSIPIDAMHGDRIVDVMKKFFADATFAADGKLNHTMEGEAKVKNYTHNGNNLTFNLYEGSDTYKVNATTFPDEDGDRLFIIIPKQAAWLGGLVDLVEKENAGLKLDAEQIAALEKEFMETFETFTVILSLSKK